MEEIIKAENILEKNSFDRFLCKSCGNISTDLKLCQKCDQSYCYSCALNLKLCLSCKDNFNFRRISKGELKCLKSMKIKCKNSHYGCKQELNYETVILHHNQCDYTTVNCQACNNLLLVSQVQQHHNDCNEFKRICQECSNANIKSDLNHNSQVLLKHTFNLIKSESIISKQQIRNYHNEKLEDIKELKSSLNDNTLNKMSEIKSMALEIVKLKELLGVNQSKNFKSCVVCRKRSRSVVCSICNFKSSNLCYEICLVLNKNFCLKFSELPKNCKFCKNGTFKECDINLSNLKKALKLYSSCNKPYCKVEHNLHLCSDFNKSCCFDCISNCNLKLCRNRKNESSNCISNSSKFNCNQSILVGCSGGKVACLDPKNMKLIEDYNVGEKSGNVINILLIADKIVTGLWDDKVIVWNDRKFTSLNYKIHYKYTSDIRHLKDSQLGIGSLHPNKCFLINVCTNKLLCEHSLMTSPSTLCKVNDSTMLVGCQDGSIKLWKIDNNSFFMNGIPAHSKTWINSVIKLENWNEYFASSGSNGRVKLWTVDGNNKNITEITSKRISNANVIGNYWCKLKELQDGRIVHCTQDNSVSIWDIKSLTNILMTSHSSCVYDFFELSDNYLLSCSSDRTIKKWDLRKNEKSCDKFFYDQYIFRFQSNKQQYN